ncbi:hypothetical protein TWF694_003937 [Orbilia ellipsospora]|uniref:Peptidase S9 prolyl oligopeptidase catalytic domain-containing protein n=1 Tax=Orbilia ellipsospora TaxID=2528407 RepID=A0AAV9WWJ5_9PEZI
MVTVRALSLSLLLKIAASTLLLSQKLDLQDAPVILFSTTWNLCGPFKLGTRESEWGTDPLERYGGFQALEPDETSTFRSSLARNGTVKWTENRIQTAQSQGLHSVSLMVSFPEINWNIMVTEFGWAGMQFQAWARGYFDFNPPLGQSNCIVALHTKNALEVWVDGEHYFGGDVYGYGKAPILLNLNPQVKRHVINIRVFNDIRMFGGRNPPQVDVELTTEYLCDVLSIVKESFVFPDIVNDKPASKFATIGVRNNGRISVDILEVRSKNGYVDLQLETKLSISPGQTRPIKMRFDTKRSLQSFEATLSYSLNRNAKFESLFTIPLNTIEGTHKPHKYTYIHPSGIVSYGVLRPPSLGSHCKRLGHLPILVSLHGAGVEASSDFSKRTFDDRPDLCAWLLIPSGVTTWAGDDWHIWGMSDIDAAISAIGEWKIQTRWDGPDADGQRLFFAGHSNGGQGVWHALIHRNDKAIGASPLSGYITISAYVPYDLWQELEPRAVSILQSSTNAYRTDLLAENLAGIPIFQGHGEYDDNVPPFHSRRMFEILHETMHLEDISNPGYHEFPRANHWFEGIMTTPPLGEFLSQFFNKVRPLPQIGSNFSVVIGNPGVTTSRGGLRALQLTDPTVLGRINVEILVGPSIIWKITTSNIRRLELDLTLAKKRTLAMPSTVEIDGNIILITAPEVMNRMGFVFTNRKWISFSDDSWKNNERHGLQLGSLPALFNSRGCINVLFRNNTTLSPLYNKKALEVSRNLYQYYSADTKIGIIDDLEQIKKGNVVVLGRFDKTLLPEELRSTFPVSQTESGDINLQLQSGEKITYKNRPGIGMVLLFPIGKDRVGILIWGSNDDAVRRASMLMPIRTGSSQPDFIILGPESGWNGAAGALALAMFDSHWQFRAEASYFRK